MKLKLVILTRAKKKQQEEDRQKKECLILLLINWDLLVQEKGSLLKEMILRWGIRETKWAIWSIIWNLFAKI